MIGCDAAVKRQLLFHQGINQWPGTARANEYDTVDTAAATQWRLMSPRPRLLPHTATGPERLQVGSGALIVTVGAVWSKCASGGVSGLVPAN